MSQATATKVALNYSMSIVEMLSACRHVGEVDHPYVEELIEKYYPVSGQGEVLTPSLEMLWSTSGSIGLTGALNTFKRKGLRPATLPELMMYVVNNPEEASENPVVALCPVEITPTSWLKGWYGECPKPFVPVFTNYTRHHDGSRLVRPGKQVFNLIPAHGSWFGGDNSINWRFAVVQE